MKLAKKNKHRDGLWVLSQGLGTDRLLNESLMCGAKIAFAFTSKKRASRELLGKNAIDARASFIEMERFVGGLMRLPGQGYMDILSLDGQYFPLTKLGIEGIRTVGLEVEKVLSDMCQTHERYHTDKDPSDMVESLCYKIIQSKMGVAPYIITTLELGDDYPSTNEFIDEALANGDEWLKPIFETFLQFPENEDLPRDLYLIWEGENPVSVGGQLYVSKHRDELATVIKTLHESTMATEELRSLYVGKMNVVDLHIHLYIWISSNAVQMSWFEGEYTPYSESGVDFLLLKGIKTEDQRDGLLNFVNDLRASVQDVVGIDSENMDA